MGNEHDQLERYRPTMDADVVHSWAVDAQAEIDSLRALLAAREPDARPAVSTAPARIYLQISDDASHYDDPFPGEHAEQVTWCSESVMDCEVPYVRADLLAATRPVVPDVDTLAQHIRKVDGNHDIGAGALAEAIVEWLTAATPQP